jgi:glutathione peroxidase-family protein
MIVVVPVQTAIFALLLGCHFSQNDYFVLLNINIITRCFLFEQFNRLQSLFSSMLAEQGC